MSIKPVSDTNIALDTFPLVPVQKSETLGLVHRIQDFFSNYVDLHRVYSKAENALSQKQKEYAKVDKHLKKHNKTYQNLRSDDVYYDYYTNARGIFGAKEYNEKMDALRVSIEQLNLGLQIAEANLSRAVTKDKLYNLFFN